MSMKLMTKLTIAAAGVTVSLAAMAAKPAQAATLQQSSWDDFYFTNPGQPAQDTYMGGDTFWEFTAPVEGAFLQVTDAFLTGDVFNVFDFGQLIGTTSFAPTSADYQFDPNAAYADPAFSHGSFTLAAGLHNISIIPTASPYASQGGGAAYLRWDANTTNTKQVPEPLTVGGTLLAGGMGLLMKKKQARQQAKAEVKP